MLSILGGFAVLASWYGVNGVETEKALQDKISALPGQPSVEFDQYGGYLNLGTSEKEIFYWLQMTDNTEELPPVVLWTNGGPGCSGLLGCLTEQGAFRIMPDQTLMVNPGRWNQKAHMLFVEQPAGVGFSYSDDTNDYTTGDAQAAADIYALIVAFFEAFPDLAANPFYLSSESYGGHYMPMTAWYLLQQNNPNINFKGFLVGNPYTDPVENAKGMYDTWYGRSMVSRPLYLEYVDVCNDGEKYDDPACQDVMGQLAAQIGDVYYYGLDWPVCHDASSLYSFKSRRWFMDKVIGDGLKRPMPFKDMDTFHDNKVMPNSGYSEGAFWDACQVDYMTTYLNTAAVQSALHAKAGTVWAPCSDEINYNSSDLFTYMEGYYNKLLDSDADLRILVFSGDDDSVCGTLGTQSWIWDLGYSTQTKWVSWEVDDQVAGYWIRFSVKPNKSFTFATVHSAGHEVPWYKTMRGYELFKNYIDGQL